MNPLNQKNESPISQQKPNIGHLSAEVNSQKRAHGYGEKKMTLIFILPNTPIHKTKRKLDILSLADV